jgi:hypothetical protein
LEKGAGWRIWLSQPGEHDFDPPGPIEVRHNGLAQRYDSDWTLFEPLEGLTRRMGVLTVELDKAARKPGERYDITIPGAGTFHWRSLPARVDERGMTFLVASCFWLPGDKEGAYRRSVLEVSRIVDPTFKLLIGDQIYHDYPLHPVPRNIPKLFGERYESYWGDPYYRDVLASAPNYFTCDDHEFWNNYPERQIWLPQTYDKFRKASDAAAQATYHHFQRGLNPDEGRFYSFDIDPVSFFVTDARSERQDINGNPKAQAFSDEQWAALDAWATGLQGPGVIVLGQPLFDKEGGKTDRSLASFKSDFARLCGIFEESLKQEDGRKAHDILILTGDIHTGRYAAATLVGRQPAAYVHEFVTSPASRVGPFIAEVKPKKAPGNFSFPRGATEQKWEIAETELSRTIDDNIAAVRMRRWGDRVNFELELWRVRPRDPRPYWKRALRGRPSEGPVVSIFRKELLLR